MRKIIFKTGIAFLFLLIFGAGCDKEKEDTEECNYETTETDPAKLINGRWKLTKIWMGDNEGYRTIDDSTQIDYWQFGQDSLAEYQYIFDGDLRTENHNYWVDSLLNFNHEGGYPLTPWHYEFPDKCTLKLSNAFLALSPVSLIYKRTER